VNVEEEIMTSPGTLMLSEMNEQTRVLSDIHDRINDIVGEIRSLTADLRGVAFLARGSSDNAALLGRYAVETATGLPTCLIAPSILKESAPQRFSGWLVVALSQSGGTPEIVTAARHLQESGALVVAITNDASSDLAQISDVHLDVAAGRELAVPATKTVTGQMMMCLAVATGLDRTGLRIAHFGGVPDAVATVLGDQTAVRDAAAELAAFDRVAVVGRKWCYPAALETALKIQETTGVMAHGFSSADFRHGPIAVCGPTNPAVLLAGATGSADDDTRHLVDELATRHTWSVLVGTTGAPIAWPALGHAGECLLATVRGQQLAYHWSMLAGVDPDRPAGLNKVTLTH
jgi:glucosamine--fructose-6-phosphate aminotransferase (isomerizing)